jgi:hypothetical protein
MISNGNRRVIDEKRFLTTCMYVNTYMYDKIILCVHFATRDEVIRIAALVARYTFGRDQKDQILGLQ